ncbi:hypothetical protein F503_00079 [Ophiostoma piceae UAMH 11346]|uniref:Uncharacterized protein n=1 Tax=Ophiostoma piceae (strain UAMH 11346) TaxID=1262450 RepID=S3CVW0_OPHP1|nr:hypothetical protein F503_00079 [Ophiostoma piceae UAMH 11346]
MCLIVSQGLWYKRPPSLFEEPALPSTAIHKRQSLLIPTMSTNESPNMAAGSGSDSPTENQALMGHGIRQILPSLASDIATVEAEQYDQPIQEVQDVLRAVENAMDVVYNATISWDEENNDRTVAQKQQLAYKNATYVTKILKHFGKAVVEIEHGFGTLELRDTNTETAALIVASTTQALTSLVPLEGNGPLPPPELRAIVDSLSCKCYTQIGLELERRSSFTWRFSNRLVRAGELKTAIHTAISSFRVMGVPYNHTENVAAALNQLIARYVHSLAAINGTAEQISKVYLVFANEKLGDMFSKQMKESGQLTLYEDFLEYASTFNSWDFFFGRDS